MQLSCPQCQFRFAVTERQAGSAADCPSCGQAVRVPGSDTGKMAAWVTLGCILLLLLLLLFFLARPVGTGLAHDAKQTIFGAALAAAADGMGKGEEGEEGEGSGESGDGTEGMPGEDAEAMDSRETAARNRQNEQAMAGDFNEALPGQDAVSMPDRSIGFLRKMFGLTPDGEIRAGEGGTEDFAENMGNTINAPDRNLNDMLAGNDDPSMPMTRPSMSSDPMASDSGNTPAPSAMPTNQVMLSDSFERRLAEAGARSGDVRVSLMWNNQNDIDLHVVDPRGEEINYNHRRSRTGGVLDVDKNAGFPLTTRPVENVYWPAQGAPQGRYRVFVNHFRNNGGQDPTRFTVRVLVRGQTFDVPGAIRFGEGRKLVYEFQVPAN